MPTLCDFTQILGEASKYIPQTSANAQVPLPDFNTGGRRAGSSAFLIISARNLGGSAKVFINDIEVGTFSAPGEAYSTQLISLSGQTLRDGDNEIYLKEVTDQFRIKNVICFFHQVAG